MTKLQARTALAERLRQHFGERMRRLVELEDNPFEASAENELWTVLVLADEAYERERDRRAATRIGMDVSGETDFTFLCHVYTVAASDYQQGRSAWAEAAKAGGVLA